MTAHKSVCAGFELFLTCYMFLKMCSFIFLHSWMLEQKIRDLKGIDALFPSCDTAEGILSFALFKEIMNDVPMKILKPRFPGDARKQLAKFAEACKKAIETR